MKKLNAWILTMKQFLQLRKPQFKHANGCENVNYEVLNNKAKQL
jgi:hypothetical protein